MCAHVWDGAPFDETADPTANIRASLDSARAVATLAGLYPWMPHRTTADFVETALYLRGWAEAGSDLAQADLDVLVARYAHAVLAVWANLPGNLPTEHRPARPSVLRRLVALIKRKGQS